MENKNKTLKKNQPRATLNIYELHMESAEHWRFADFLRQLLFLSLEEMQRY